MANPKLPQNLIDYLEKALERPYTDWECINGWGCEYVLRDFEGGFNIVVKGSMKYSHPVVKIVLRKFPIPLDKDEKFIVQEGDEPRTIHNKLTTQRIVFEADAIRGETWDTYDYRFPRKLVDKADMKVQQNIAVILRGHEAYQAEREKEKNGKLAEMLPEAKPRLTLWQKVLASCGLSRKVA